MIDPVDEDIGRNVIYRPQHSDGKPEQGVITSFNKHYVFVRYDPAGQGGIATQRDHLEWLSGKDRVDGKVE